MGELEKVVNNKRSPLRDNLYGLSLDSDRLWLLHDKDEVYAITEYNDELTGYDPRLTEINREVFHYGGNAYYIITTYAKQKGWRVEPFEDRF